MKTPVLDSQALLIYLKKDTGYRELVELFQSAVEAGRPVLISSISFGEVLTLVLREYGLKNLWEVDKMMEKLPVEVVSVSAGHARTAAKLMSIKKIPASDAYTAAVAKSVKGTVITGKAGYKNAGKEFKVKRIGQ